MEKKSDFLDELRLEVGLAFDYANNHEDFLEKVLNAIYLSVDEKCMISIYKPLPNGGFERSLVLGNIGKTKKEEFMGAGFFSLCNMKASLILKKDGIQSTVAPIYSSSKLEHILAITVVEGVYNLTEQDLYFMDELVRFIGVKYEILKSI